MAASSHSFWVFFFGVYVSAGVRPHPTTTIKYSRNSDLQDILSKIPISLPEGTDLKNVAIDIKSITVKNCTDVHNQLTSANGQLQEMTLRNTQLDVEAFGLRRDVRLLRVQLATCNSKAVSGSYRAQVYNKMQQLLDTSESDNFKILKVLTLSREVGLLDKRVKQGAANATQAEIRVLKNEWQLKMNELANLIQQIERGHSNPALVLQTIELQSQIWDLEESTRGETEHQIDQRIAALQEQLDMKLRKLRGQGAAISVLMELISSHSKISVTQRLLRVVVEESLKNLADKERELKQKGELLKKKILRLNREERNSELTKEILALQAELDVLRLFVYNTKNETVYQRQELTAVLEQEEQRKASLQKQLEESEYAEAHMIKKIIGMMAEVRELQRDWQQQTTTTTTVTQSTTLEAQLQAKEQEYAKAQAAMKDLRREFEVKMAELNKAEDAKAALVLSVMTLHNELRILGDQISTTTDLDRLSELTRQLEEKQDELHLKNNEMKEQAANSKIVSTIIQLQNQILELQRNSPNGISSHQEKELREQLKIKEAEHSRYQAEITALQIKLNQTGVQCSTFEQKITDLQNDLDEKMKKLQTQSDSVSSLALEVSTLTLQQEELKRQLQNTESKAKVQELQKQLEEKNVELAKKTEELQARSTQPQRFLQIIAIQTEIEKLVTVAVNNTDYSKIRALEDHLKYLISGIKDETDENSKMVFKVMTLQEEIQRLQKQEKRQSAALLGTIKVLEGELEEVRNQITEKTLVLDTSDIRINNMTAEIMELHAKLQPLEDEISYLKNKHAETVTELQQRLTLTKTQLHDSERLLEDADTRNFASIMEIIELREQLKTSQEQTAKAVRKSISEVEMQLQMKEKENKKLETSSRDLKRKVTELEMCCSDRNTPCEDLQAQLHQSHSDVDLLERQLQDKEVNFKQLLQQMQQELEERTRENNRLNQQNVELQNIKIRIEVELQELKNTIHTVEENKIFPRKVVFDPQTANPRIILSVGNTEMSSTGQMQDIPDNPGRFDVLLAVLGDTGYSSGRNYWEVSVAGKSCYHVGMASESASRRGMVDVSPAHGFWSIILNRQGLFRAIDKRPVTLTVQVQPNTLGILLDYKKGEVSFYDAGTRSHMYSFQGQRFTDKIYPFINFCDEDTNPSPIVLLTPGSTDWIQ